MKIPTERRMQGKIGRHFFVLGIVLAMLSPLAGCGPGIGEDEGGAGASPAKAGSGQPHLATGPAGEIVLSWLEAQGDGHELRFATFDGDSWSAASTVAIGVDWFVNWADYPSVEPVSEKLWLAHWLVKQPNSAFAYDVFFAVSNDSGTNWSAEKKLHADDSAAEHGFVSFFADGRTAGAIWLDGRQLAQREAPGMSLQSALIAEDGALIDEQLVDPLACDCCQTDVALGADGPIIVYRDRTPDEIRDIAVLRKVQGDWQQPQVVAVDDWLITGCPINGPAIAAADSAVAVAWYTAANEQPLIRLARSLDSGGSFADAVTVSADRPLGRVDVVVLEEGQAVVSWMARTEDGAASFNVRRAGLDGTLGPTVQIARMAPNRPAGFPQMVRSGDALLFAWTDVSKRESIVRTASVRLSALE